MSSPKISIVMAVYNTEKYVHESVQSMLNQTYADFEFIIVDDASTDQTSEIVRSFKDSRICYVRNISNLGQTRSLNVGINKSRGEFIARMDADDVSMPDRLKIQYGFMSEHPEISAVSSAMIYMDASGKTMRTFSVPTDPTEINYYMSGSGDLSYWCVVHPAVFIRKSALDDVGNYDEIKGEIKDFPQDFDLWTRMVIKGHKFANIKHPLLKYRKLPQSYSHANPQRYQQHCFEISVGKVRHYLPKLGDRQVLSLVRMLEFQPQISSEDGELIFEIFDKYFRAYIKVDEDQLRYLYFRTKLKFYYLPQLFKTNKLLSIKNLLSFLFVYPGFLFDKKFYYKCIRTMLGRWIK